MPVAAAMTPSSSTTLWRHKNHAQGSDSGRAKQAGAEVPGILPASGAQRPLATPVCPTVLPLLRPEPVQAGGMRDGPGEEPEKNKHPAGLVSSTPTGPYAQAQVNFQEVTEPDRPEARPGLCHIGWLSGPLQALPAFSSWSILNLGYLPPKTL